MYKGLEALSITFPFTQGYYITVKSLHVELILLIGLSGGGSMTHQGGGGVIQGGGGMTQGGGGLTGIEHLHECTMVFHQFCNIVFVLQIMYHKMHRMINYVSIVIDNSI